MIYLVEHSCSSLSPEVLKKYLTATFIETGTNIGHGVQAALEAGFQKVVSIDADLGMWQHSVRRFSSEKRVDILLSDSPTMLRILCPQLKDPCTFFLDAHSDEQNPLLGELAAIGTSPCKTHTILIDDVRMFGTVQCWREITGDRIVRAVQDINPNYVFSREDTPNGRDDLLVARVAA